ncbi:alanine racemase [Candidatus Uhrbacteria bacterium]|nr:alanine racemase [Candidatus Uhrbacteria bacterium]
MVHKTWIEISKSALRHNAQAFLGLAGDAEVMAVVKANAYGHGVIAIARNLQKTGIKLFGVDSLDEAHELRREGMHTPILVLGYTPLSRLVEAVEQGFSFVAYNPETFRALSRLKTKKQFKLHLPIETGLQRQGIRLKDLPAIIKQIKSDSRMVVEGVHTHFANIEDTKSRAYADKQLSEYKKGIAILKEHNIYPKYLHTAATAASILYSDTHFNLLRAGIGLYGLWPSKETRTSKHKKHDIVLKPVLEWKTMIAQVKSVPKGSAVSYGLTERVKRDSKIAVLPIGYYDGFDRSGMSKRAHVLIRGRRCKVIGRVCMNMCMVDVTDVPGVRIEDEVVLIGKSGKQQITAEDMAKLAGTINYEVVARLNPQIPKILVK